MLAAVSAVGKLFGWMSACAGAGAEGEAVPDAAAAPA